MEHRDCPSVRPGEGLLSGENECGRAGRSVTNRSGFKPWPVLVLSVLGSAAAAAAVGCVCALIYPILKGFWSILVLSVSVGCICCVFSWTLSYLDSYQPGIVSIKPLKPAHFRAASGFNMGFGVAVLNGIMSMLTVIWSLT
ncbi:hypothetical protein F7725_009333 [Dissostichus mawsoni]|uniref:ADP-ribosylation factor-like protein 6-interacting protein 6 n=1 Tax=Dissostichus mawsoni TaxID=36200 RepID=A0A7J5Z6R1_DISMA|nr:hypothetical protein F7725_009333 [Dissostichus mawsoni]